MSTKYAVIRKPVLMEDEGRAHLCFTCDTKEEAEAWLDKNAPPGDYFHRSDYKIMRTT